MAEAEIIEEEDLNRLTQAQKGTASLDDAAVAAWMEERGIMPEDFDTDFGLIDPGDTVIIRPYGGEDDDILLNELRPRFVVCYEPNLAFIRRLEVSSYNLSLLLRYQAYIVRCTRIVILVLHSESIKWCMPTRSRRIDS